jgi:hypothetical protein
MSERTVTIKGEFKIVLDNDSFRQQFFQIFKFKMRS